jgi:hypothetical protein
MQFPELPEHPFRYHPHLFSYKSNKISQIGNNINKKSDCVPVQNPGDKQLIPGDKESVSFLVFRGCKFRVIDGH